jgi:uncharacterized damage-inducible protein DinB
MSVSLQSFLAQGTKTAVADLITALERIPQDKRAWSPAPTARTPLDQIAECALLNDNTASILTRKEAKDFDFAAYLKTKAELANDEDRVVALLKSNTEKVIAVIAAMPDEDLEIEVDLPWGKMTLAQIASHAYWNTCYHEGQINYLASILGTLEH